MLEFNVDWIYLGKRERERERDVCYYQSYIDGIKLRVDLVNGYFEAGLQIRVKKKKPNADPTLEKQISTKFRTINTKLFFRFISQYN